MSFPERLDFPKTVYVHECGHKECGKTFVSESEKPPEGIECASIEHDGTYEYTGGTEAYRRVRESDGEVCDACGQVKMDAFSPEEISDLSQLLDQISSVALDENSMASLIEYKGEEVVIADPAVVNDNVYDALSDAAVELESETGEGENQQ